MYKRIHQTMIASRLTPRCNYGGRSGWQGEVKTRNPVDLPRVHWRIAIRCFTVPLDSTADLRIGCIAPTAAEKGEGRKGEGDIVAQVSFVLPCATAAREQTNSSQEMESAKTLLEFVTCPVQYMYLKRR
ncbi:hypothetical protein DOTSEDRAFT_69997 [Dothistroma septosporum NZE10]|uniref:Uncharacterized protein n=1 Tax=Dothistroma septosporum (strain NZE10 / CBS 128990) TaxID=675120 RepID=N1PZ14_DOTSN|nr:hypothetical protein DOTSEDRAFT_69997 [Dothistroma septosporum NZE10]